MKSDIPESICSVRSEQPEEGLLLLDDDSTIIHFNPDAKKLLDCRNDELHGKPLKNFILPEVVQEFNGLLDEVRSGSQWSTKTVFITLVRTDGAHLPACMRLLAGNSQLIALFTDASGAQQPAGHSKVFTSSPSPEAKAEERVRELKMLMRNILENTHDGFIALDFDWRYFYVNEKAAFLTKLSKEELIGRRIWDLFPDLIGSRFEAELHKAMEQRVTVSFDDYRKKNKLIWMNIHANPIQQGLAVFFEDITEKKQAEQALLDLNDKLENKVRERTLELTKLLEREKAINEMKSRFVAMASHEFRTPLSTLLSSLSLLEMYVRPVPQSTEAKHFNRIKSSVDQLTVILNNFLSLDKLENGKLDIKSVEFDVNDFAGDLVAELTGLLKPGQKISYTFEGRSIICQDKNIIKNMVYNLMSNAIKFSPENKPIDLQIITQEGEIEIVVKDRGIGIPPEEQEFIFSRLFRASNATNVSGTGLGLNIVRRYVELLGGTISFLSEPYEGTEFCVTIPHLRKDKDFR